MKKNLLEHIDYNPLFNFIIDSTKTISKFEPISITDFI